MSAYSSSPPPGYSANKDELLGGLTRVEGQVREIEDMVTVTDGRRRIEIVTQISAIQADLDAIALGLVDDHARQRITDSRLDDQDKNTADLMGAVGRVIRRS